MYILVCMEGYYVFTGVLSFQTLSSDVTERNVTKLCHMFGSEPGLKMGITNLRVSSPKTWGSKTA